MKHLIFLLAFYRLSSCYVPSRVDIKCNGVCECDNGHWYGYFKATCPTDVEITFQYSYYELEVVIECGQQQSDLSVLSGINLTGIYDYGLVSIKGCHLPNTSIYDLLASKGVTNYNSLDISSYNGTLQRKYFENLHNISYLKISKSNLGVLPCDVFAGLPNLSQLYLGFSSFSLTKCIFQYSPRLQKVYLAKSEVSNYNVVFDHLKVLEVLEIVGTNNFAFQLQPGQFADLMKTKTVTISGMNLKSVPEDTFSRSKNFRKVNLSNNLLRSFDENTFSDLEIIEILDLSHNKITHLQERLFSRTKLLFDLDLSDNQLDTIEPNLFTSLSKLVNLNLSYNKLRYVSGGQFSQLTSIEVIDLSHNQLISLAQDPLLSDLDRSVLYNCTTLQQLYLQNNSLTELYEDWTNALANLYLYKLNMSYNNITDLQTFGNTYKMISTSNARNEKTSTFLSENGYRENTGRPTFRMMDIFNNPLNCSCDYLTSLYNVSRYLTEEDNAKCKSPTRLEKVKIKEIDWPVEYERCKQLAPEKDQQCPEGCRCVYRPLTRSSVINCQYSDLQTYPRTLPVVPDADHTELNLYSNRLQEFRMPDDPGYKNVTFLNLANNSLSKLDINSASTRLKKLDLRHNNLNTLSEETLKFLEKAEELEWMELAGNPWNCDVSNYRFAQLVRDKYSLIQNNVTCADGNPVEKINYLYETHKSNQRLAILYVLMILLITVVILTVLYYRNRQKVLVYCFSSRWKVLRWLVSHPDIDDDDKLYDAFIVFAQEDDTFVGNHLVPYLEETEDRKYKLCLHYRDWIPGEQILSQIGRSVRSSRRTIVVLSPNFLRSVWGVAEFRIAHAEALKDGTARVIVILYEEVADEEIDEELKAYLQTNTYVKWGSPWFWRQLTYALPHPPDRERGVLHYFSRGKRCQEDLQSAENHAMGQK